MTYNEHGQVPAKKLESAALRFFRRFSKRIRWVQYREGALHVGVAPGTVTKTWPATFQSYPVEIVEVAAEQVH